MTRPLKFRVYDKLNKCYVENKNGEIYWDIWELDHLGEFKDRVIVEQYTGLIDDNLKEICEGDTLEWYKVTGVKITRAVEWNVAIQAFTAGDYMLNGIIGLGCRVVGNIHEDKERERFERLAKKSLEVF